MLWQELVKIGNCRNFRKKSGIWSNNMESNYAFLFLFRNHIKQNQILLQTFSGYSDYVLSVQVCAG